jgi:hypothetical protein
MHACFIAALCLALGALCACRGSSSAPAVAGDEKPPSRHEAAAPEPAAAPEATPALAPEPEPAPEPALTPAFIDLDAGGFPEKTALRAMEAVPVWDAVVNRGEYLGRRGKQGAIHGRLGEPVSGGPYHWFIDDTEGAGALGVRLAVDPALGPALSPEPGQRLLVWGSWHVDGDLRWYWKATRMARLEARDIEVPVESRSQPGHVIAAIPAPPSGALLVSEAVAEPPPQPVDILFEITRVPASRFTGWEIGDSTSWKPVARLFLPGERESHGAQDLRSPGEYWRLERNTRYVIRVQRIAPPRPGVRTTLKAINAPRRVVDAGR